MFLITFIYIKLYFMFLKKLIFYKFMLFCVFGNFLWVKMYVFISFLYVFMKFKIDNKIFFVYLQ